MITPVVSGEVQRSKEMLGSPLYSQERLAIPVLLPVFLGGAILGKLHTLQGIMF